jgi:biotin operon repressor
MFRLLDNDVWIRELVGVAAKRGSLLSGHHPANSLGMSRVRIIRVLKKLLKEA